MALNPIHWSIGEEYRKKIQLRRRYGLINRVRYSIPNTMARKWGPAGWWEMIELKGNVRIIYKGSLMKGMQTYHSVNLFFFCQIIIKDDTTCRYSIRQYLVNDPLVELFTRSRSAFISYSNTDFSLRIILLDAYREYAMETRNEWGGFCYLFKIGYQMTVLLMLLVVLLNK